MHSCMEKSARATTRWTVVSCMSAGIGYAGTSQPLMRRRSDRSYSDHSTSASSFKPQHTMGMCDASS